MPVDELIEDKDTKSYKLDKLKYELEQQSSSEDEDDKECNCGTIANDGITDDCYWLEIRSDCSQNKKQFCFDQDIWFDNHPGDHFCVTNETGW